MNGQPDCDPMHLAAKIAQLVEERGWNQEEFAHRTGLSRQTARQILIAKDNRRLQNATVGACAEALGVSVADLRNSTLDSLLSRMRLRRRQKVQVSPPQRYEEVMQPQLAAWMETNSLRAQQLTTDEIDELLSLQGTGGPLSLSGVDRFVGLIERKRKLVQQVQAIAGTEYCDLLEQIVSLLYDKVRPYANRR